MACLYAFDLLHLRATDLRPVELVGRRAMLKKLIRTAAPVLIFSEHMDAADGERMFRHACALGLEGHRVEAPRQALQLGTLPPLEEGQKSELRPPMTLGMGSGGQVAV